MEINKVLFISQEIAPYIADTPMALLCRDLPQGLQERKVEVRAFMPKYGSINERRYQLHPMIRLSGMNIIIDDSDHPLLIKVATLQPSRIQVYFIFNDDYFAHGLTKQLETETYADNNDERSIFYVRAVIEAARKLRWEPDIIHCSGWITALAPLYMRQLHGDDPCFRDSKIVYALWDNDFQKPLDPRLAEKLKQDGFNDQQLTDIIGKSADYIDLTRIALRNCDAVCQCSPTIKPEVKALIDESGLPFLPYQGEENTTDAYMAFYESL